MILAGAGTATPPPVTALVEPDLLDAVPPDVDELLRLLLHADVYFQDEVQFAFHPTLTRVWCLRQHPDLVLRQAGSPYADQVPVAIPLADAA